MSDHPHTTAPSGTSRDPAPGDLELVRLFLNTHDHEDEDERLSTPDALREWLSGHGLIAPEEPVGAVDLRRAVEVREALRALCLANNGVPLDPAALQTLNSAAGAGPLRVRFEDGGGRLAPAGAGVGGALGALLAIVVGAMGEGTWERLKACPADDCLWVFYDRSRNRSGRWCTMAECGNRAKARAYRERARKADR